ncbi:MAG: hypothetical protein IJX14_03035, partial [Clostridia bacterium]|nr:hypothetical protein [Clostridia bacterium]
FYWAQPIPPYENVYTESEENLQNTTGLLINELKKTGRLDQDHYYELIVDADFVTVDDLLFTNTDTGRGFHTSDEGITSYNIQTFLKTIGAASDDDTFTYVLDIAVDEHYVPYGSKIQLTGFDGPFEKVAITGDNGTIQDSEYTVLKEDETVALSSQITDKKLTMYVYYDGGRYNKITIYLGSNVQ